MSTIAGKLLRIDLTTGTHREEDIPRSHFAQFLSARGLGVKYLYDELAPGIEPLSPENKLVLGIGILGGTRLQGFSKWSVVTKSPMTGTLVRSFVGGNFGVWMKSAGYDQIIIEGMAASPTYLTLDAEGVHHLDAADLTGLDPRETQQRLKARHGVRTEAACIGLAGEKQVRYAVITAGERTASRGGVGTVMGSKNLKAIAIQPGKRKPMAHEPARFDELARQQIAMLRTNPRRKALNTLGTPYITTVLMEKGILPVRNFREGSIDGIAAITGDEFLKVKEAPAGCYGCMTRCGGMRTVASGPYRGTQIDGPEYESVFALGPLLGIADRQFIIDANAVCDFYGIDTISAGVSVAFAVELFERGVIGMQDTGGLALCWGDRLGAMALLEQIGRREGLGELLGQGVKRAAEVLGGAARDCAVHIKGLEIPGYEPRAVKGYGLSMATSNIGGNHMYGRPRDELAGKVDPLTEVGKGASIAGNQKAQAVEDSLIACTFGNSGLTLEDYAGFLVAATGIAELGSVDELTRIGERIVCLERCFNVREGFGRKDDTLPKRMLTEPLEKAGPASGQTVADLDTLLDEYYQALGYTPDGVPSPDRLAELGLGALG
ncbi:MAG: aldehyde ferredoxin oxidoreductase family protein [Deferrisomatales bacterium]|nr:aldehyde ferredoxin oxidoreductase family protein [Deferrisomatales bacterium]